MANTIPAALYGGPLHATLLDVAEGQQVVERTYTESSGSGVMRYERTANVGTDPQGIARVIFDWVRPA